MYGEVGPLRAEYLQAQCEMYAELELSGLCVLLCGGIYGTVVRDGRGRMRCFEAVPE